MKILSIASNAGIRVYAIKRRRRIDYSIQSRIGAMAFSKAAEFERDPISARTEEAPRARKASARPKGPGMSKTDPFHPEIEAPPRNNRNPLKLDEKKRTQEIRGIRILWRNLRLCCVKADSGKSSAEYRPQLSLRSLLHNLAKVYATGMPTSQLLGAERMS